MLLGHTRKVTNIIYVHMKIRFLLILFTLVAFTSQALYNETDRRLKRAQKAVADNEIPMAIGIYSQFLKDYRPYAPKKDQLRYADIFMTAQNLCLSHNRFLEALEFSSYGRKAAHKGGNSAMEANFIRNIGNLHSAFDDYERAIYYYHKGYRLSLDNNLPEQQWKFLLSLVPPCIKLGNIPQAKEYFRKINLMEGPDSITSIFFNDYLQGLIAYADSSPELALHFHRRALSTALRNGMAVYSTNEYWEIGNVFRKKERNDSARNYYNMAVKEACRTGQPGQLPKIYLSLAKLAQTEGDSAAYERYNTLHNEASDAIFNIKTFNSQRNQLVEYEELIKDTTIDGLNKRIWIQSTVLVSVGMILLVILIFYVLLKKRINALRYANNKLLDRNRELIRAEELNRKLMDDKLEAAATEDENNFNNPLDTKTEDTTDEETRNYSTVSPRAQYLSDEQKEILLSRIRKVLNQTDQPFNPEFSLNTLAQLVKSNTKYVSWVINETYDKNFKTILNELRVREASKILDNHETYGNYTIQAVGEVVGYKSSTSFIQAFKKLVGMTPSVYQKLAIQRTKDTESEQESER